MAEGAGCNLQGLDPKGFLVQKLWKSKRYAFIEAGSAHTCVTHPF